MINNKLVYYLLLLTKWQNYYFNFLLLQILPTFINNTKKMPEMEKPVQALEKMMVMNCKYNNFK